MQNPHTKCRITLLALLGAWTVLSCTGSSGGGGGGSADTGVGSDAVSIDTVSDTASSDTASDVTSSDIVSDVTSGDTVSDVTNSDMVPDATGGGEDIDRILAFGSACAPEEDRGSISVFFTFLDSFVHLNGISVSTEYLVWSTVIDCMLAAVDCDGFTACIEATEAQDALCASRDLGEAFCDGETVIECGWDEDDTTEITDCEAAGLICGDYELYADAGCGSQLCDPEADPDYCDGTIMMRCEVGVFVAQDCLDRVTLHCSDDDTGEFVCTESYGGTCASDGAGGVGCEGTGPECVLDTFENSCDGTVLTSCRHGYESEFDCTRVGTNRTCGLEEDGHNGCMFAVEECDWDTPETCLDGVITYCGNGQVRHLSCDAFGFSGCGTTTVEAHSIAHCVL